MKAFAQFRQTRRFLVAASTATALIAGVSLQGVLPTHAGAVKPLYTNRLAHITNLSPLTIHTDDGKYFTVQLTSNTTIRRRFYGVSSPSELEVNDRVQVIGTPPANGVITADAIQDFSIQVAHSEIKAQVLSIDTTNYATMTVRVTAHEATDPAFGIGATVTVDITPTTPVTLFGNKQGTVQNLQPGMFIQLYGLSDHPNHVIPSPKAITEVFSQAALTAAAPAD